MLTVETVKLYHKQKSLICRYIENGSRKYRAFFLTKNGYGDMVVMSMEAFELHQFDSEIYFKLKEAEMEAKASGKRFTHKEVFANLRSKIQEKAEEDV